MRCHVILVPDLSGTTYARQQPRYTQNEKETQDFDEKGLGSTVVDDVDRSFHRGWIGVTAV